MTQAIATEPTVETVAPLCDDDFAKLETLGKAAREATKRFLSHKEKDKKANKAYLVWSLFMASRVAKSEHKKADTIKLKATLKAINGDNKKGKSITDKESATINHAAMQAFLVKQNGGQPINSEAQVEKALDFKDAGGASRTHTMRSLRDGSHTSPITLSKATAKSEASTQTEADARRDIELNPTLKPIMTDILKAGDDMVEHNLMDDGQRLDWIKINIMYLYDASKRANI